MKHRVVFHRNRKVLIGKLMLLIFGISLWIVAFMIQAYISDYHGAVSVRYKEPSLRGQDIANILKGMLLREEYNIPEVTLWQRDEDILITNEALNTPVDIGLITVYGDMTKVYPNSILYGGYLSKGDLLGCVIDRNTAYKLFHSENAVGLTISLNNTEYIIRGIMKETGSNTMIVQEELQLVAEEEGIKYSCMELVFSNTEDAKRLAENFIHTNGLGNPKAYVDGYMYQKLSYLLIHIPLWFSAMLLIIYCVRRVSRLKASPVLFVSGWLGIILLSVVLIKITNVHIYYSSSMLPTRWSDFDFWGNRLKLLITSLVGREGSILYYKDMMLNRRMVLVLGGVITVILSQGVCIKVSGTEELFHEKY